MSTYPVAEPLHVPQGIALTEDYPGFYVAEAIPVPAPPGAGGDEEAIVAQQQEAAEEAAAAAAAAAANPRPHPLTGIFPGAHTRRNSRAMLKTRQKKHGKVQAASHASAPMVIGQSDATSRNAATASPASPDDGAATAASPPSPASPDDGAATAAITVTINGTPHTVPGSTGPNKRLAEFLRYDLGLTGTKIGCGEGGCGACTVLVQRAGESKVTVGNSCLLPVLGLNGASVTTTEGIVQPATGGGGGVPGGDMTPTPDPIQSEIASCDGTQCG